MAVAMASSCPLHSSSSSVLHPFFSSYRRRNALHNRNRRAITACKQHHVPNNGVFRHRRTILFMGVSVLPFLNSKSNAVEDLVPGQFENSSRRMQEPNQIAKKKREEQASLDGFLAFVNGLGMIGSGVLGALYLLTQKENSINDVTIESMKTKLGDKNFAFIAMQRSFNLQLENEIRETFEQIKKDNRELDSLMNKLSSAIEKAKGFEQELDEDNNIIRKLTTQINNLTVDFKNALEDKDELNLQVNEQLCLIEVLQEKINQLSSETNRNQDGHENIKSMFVAKEMDFKKLGSVYEQKHVELVASKFEIESLKERILKFEKELESKSLKINDLNTRVSSLHDEKDNAKKELVSVKKAYADLKICSEKQADSANLLEERRKKLEELKEQLVLALVEVNNRKVMVRDLTNENDDFREILDFEVAKAKKLEEEIRIMQNEAKDTKNEAEKLERQLEQSQSSCKELEAEFYNGWNEFSEAKNASQKVFNDFKQTNERLVDEIGSTSDVFAKTKEKLKRVSHELQETSENRDDLMKEYVETYKKLENVDSEVIEVKKTIDSLKNVVEDLRGRILMEDESRKVLKMYNDEAKRTLNKINDKVLIQLSELNDSYSKIYSLEDNKKVLNEAIDEQKEAAREARESVEGSCWIVTKLGGEIENLQKKRGEVENELGYAKGEILRLKSEMMGKV